MISIIGNFNEITDDYVSKISDLLEDMKSEFLEMLDILKGE